MDSKKNVILILNDLYSLSGYMAKYGTDVWITTIITGSFIYFIYKNHIINLLEIIKADWQNQKCNPLVMPFAGFINKPANQSNVAFVAENFSTCVFDILKHISTMSFNPFQTLLNMINDVILEMVKGFNMMRALFDKLSGSFTNILDKIYAIMINISIEFIRLVANIKDMLNKISGVLMTALYSFISAFMAMTALFLSMIDFMTIILIIIVCIIVIYIYVAVVNWGIVPIPIAGAAALPPAFAFSISAIIGVCIMIAILIPVVIVMVFLLRVMKLSTPPPTAVHG
jgi:hypothetical protein